MMGKHIRARDRAGAHRGTPWLGKRSLQIRGIHFASNLFGVHTPHAMLGLAQLGHLTYALGQEYNSGIILL